MARPDGVEHKRVTLADQGLGGRTGELALPPSAMTGTWRVRVHVEPKASAIAQSRLPGGRFRSRTAGTEARPAGTRSPGQVSTINLAGRYLYGPPAANLAIEGRGRRETLQSRGAGFCRLQSSGLADEQISPVRKTLEQLPVTDAQGRAAVGLRLPALPRTGRQLEVDVILKLREGVAAASSAP